MKTNKNILVSIALAGFAVFAAPAQPYAKSIGEDPITAYGDQIVFDVYRKGSQVGTHEMTFRRDGNDIIAETRFEVSIKVLIVPVYSYLYTSTERWRDGKLVALNASTDDNGEISTLSVTHENGTLQLSGTGGEYTAPEGLYPTTHWNSGVKGSTQLINTITGKINDVELQRRDTAPVSTKHGEITATHYAYQGDLTTEVWYDNDGKWVKMRFPGKDGVMIEYKCRVCGTEHVQTGVHDHAAAEFVERASTRASIETN